MKTGWRARFWVIQEGRFFYLYDYFGMEVLRPPKYPQACAANDLVESLLSIRRQHGDPLEPPYLLDLGRFKRAVTSEDVEEYDND